MDKQGFRRTWSMAAWILLIASWFLEFTIFGIDPFFVVIGMWILGGIVSNAIFGKQSQQNPSQGNRMTYPSYQQDQQTQNAYCPYCGSEIDSSDKFCPICGSNISTINVETT